MDSKVVRYEGHDAGAAKLCSVAGLAELIAASLPRGRIIRKPLTEAIGMVLAEPVRAASDQPVFDRAMMDGYAVCAADVAAAPADLVVAEDLPAGAVASRPLQRGQAMRINTGAAVPAGADAVVMVERTEALDGGRRVRIQTTAQAGQNIFRAGEICRTGEVVLDAPRRIGPPQISAAATLGVSEVAVFERPTLALVSTGDEIVPLGQPLPPGSIYDSNRLTLAAFARQRETQVADLGIIADNQAALETALRKALRSRIVVTIGGMSMGTLDLVPRVLERLGVRWLAHGVNIRPGRPVGYGVGPDGQQVFGLPGNPGSCFVCFNLFVQMAIDGLSGLPARLPRTLRALLRTATRGSKDHRPAYLPARLFVDEGGALQVEAVAWRGAGDAVGLGHANALLLQPEGGQAQSAGQAVEVVPIGEME